MAKLDCKLPAELVISLESLLFEAADAAESDCAWRKAIRLCRKACNAAVVEPDAVVADAFAESDVRESDVVSVEEVPFAVVEPASMAASAPNIAPAILRLAGVLGAFCGLRSIRCAQAGAVIALAGE